MPGLSPPEEEDLSDIGEASCCDASCAMVFFRSGLLGVVLEVAVDNLLEMTPLPWVEPTRDAKSDLTLSEGVGLACLSDSVEVSLAMPGNPRFPENIDSPVEISSLLFRNAADPMPLSGVCRNHEGSRDPSDAAICSRLGSSCSFETFFLFMRLSLSVVGTLLLPCVIGRCCHESVPDLARLLALWGG